MATRSRTTFQKRQKELARLEKQRDKAARRMQRKLQRDRGENPDEVSADTGIAGDEEPGDDLPSEGLPGEGLPGELPDRQA